MDNQSKAISLNASTDEFDSLQRQCKLAVTSGLLPDEYNKGGANQQLAKAVVVALKGRELGIPMMQAFGQIHVIKGKPTISAELMLALIYRAHPEAKIDFIKYDNHICSIEAARPNGKSTVFEFSMEDAEKAGLLRNDTWKKYPRAMLRSRCISEMGRTMFPDALMGCSYTPDELGGEEIVVEPPASIVPDKVVETKPEIINHAADIKPSYKAETPILDADFQNDENDTKQDNSDDDYEFTFGKWKGQMASSIPMKELENYGAFLMKTSTEKGKPISGAGQEFMDYLNRGM